MGYKYINQLATPENINQFREFIDLAAGAEQETANVWEIEQGIAIGRAAKPLFPIKWEEGFERPLSQWREELNIKPVLEGPWSWYSRPELQAAIA